MLDLRWHKGEPTWGIIDELIEMIDASFSEDELESHVKKASEWSYQNGLNAGYANGYDDGVGYGVQEGYSEGYEDGKKDAGD